MLLKWHYFIFYDWVIFHLFYDMWTLDSGLTDVTDRPVTMNILSWWGLNHDSPEEADLWSGPPGRNHLAWRLPYHLNRTSHCPLNLPRRTAPNGPLPSSFNTVVSSLCSSQIPNNARQEHFRLIIEDFGAKSLTSDFLSNENLTLTRWSTAQLFLIAQSKPLVMWSSDLLDHMRLPPEQYCSWHSYS